MPEPLRCLSDAGLGRMTEWLLDLKGDPTLPVPGGLLDGEEWTKVYEPEISITPIAADTRFDLGVQLESQLKGIEWTELYNSKGLWAWLTLINIDLVMPPKRGKRKILEIARYMPSEQWNRRYRHLLRGPWDLVSQWVRDGDDPKLVEPLLINPPHIPGELYEQFASRLDQVRSKGLLSALRALYYDESLGRLRPGSRSKNRGSVRRFGKVINQLLLTYQIPLATDDGVLAVLPAKEFKVPRS